MSTVTTTRGPAARRVPAPRRLRLRLAQRLIAVGAAAALLGLVAVLTGGDSVRGVDKAALTRYEGELVPVVRRGGQLVEQGMKPALEDLSSKHVVPPAMIAREANAWVTELTEVRRLVVALDPPRGLEQVETLIDRALGQYIVAAEVFKAATQVEGDARTARLDEGVRIAEQADALYDDASRLIQRARRAAGLGPSPDFPDPDHVS